MQDRLEIGIEKSMQRSVIRRMQATIKTGRLCEAIKVRGLTPFTSTSWICNTSNTHHPSQTAASWLKPNLNSIKVVKLNPRLMVLIVLVLPHLYAYTQNVREFETNKINTEGGYVKHYFKNKKWNLSDFSSRKLTCASEYTSKRVIRKVGITWKLSTIAFKIVPKTLPELMQRILPTIQDSMILIYIRKATPIYM